MCNVGLHWPPLRLSLLAALDGKYGIWTIKTQPMLSVLFSIQARTAADSCAVRAKDGKFTAREAATCGLSLLRRAAGAARFVYGCGKDSAPR